MEELNLSYKTTEKFKEVFNQVTEDIKDEKKKGIFADLIKEVVKTGKCIKCGACSSVCNVLDWDLEKSQPKLIGRCDACGTCFYQCPALVQSNNENLGNYLKVYSGKTKITDFLKPSNSNAQNGGITSSILYYLLKEEHFDGVVVVQKETERSWIPVAKFMTDPNDIFKSLGSIYSHAQIIPPLIDAIISKNAKKIGFVGTPCNINTILTMSENQKGFIKRLKNIEIIKIGLFCMEAFVPENLFKRLNTDGIDLSQITKMEISKNKFKLYSGAKQILKYSIKELNDYVETSCHFCGDLTSENADISVGNIGTNDDLNSVIIRSDKGREIIDRMINKNYIELNPLSKDKIQKINSISNFKKSKVVNQPE